jgi:hypothetical protein
MVSCYSIFSFICMFKWGLCYSIFSFVGRCLSFCTFSYGHCVVCSSSIYGFWLPLWYLQTLLIRSLLYVKLKIRKSTKMSKIFFINVWRKSVFDIYFTEIGTALTTILPILFQYCYKYCHSVSHIARVILLFFTCFFLIKHFFA